jgi:hypothetical protein
MEFLAMELCVCVAEERKEINVKGREKKGGKRNVKLDLVDPLTMLLLFGLVGLWAWLFDPIGLKTFLWASKYWALIKTTQVQY